jgi:hypothetical protein
MRGETEAPLYLSKPWDHSIHRGSVVMLHRLRGGWLAAGETMGVFILDISTSPSVSLRSPPPPRSAGEDH